MESAASQWWKFSLPGLGQHQVRVKNVGIAGQQVFIDGIQIEAPDGTTTFTGPGACLLELQERSNGWVLLVEGQIVPSYNPDEDTSESAVMWWKFNLPGLGTHQVRAKNMGLRGQQVFIDGSLLDAPDGTTTFTGPGASLLDFHSRGESWVLHVDGMFIPQFNPNPGLAGARRWDFSLPATGMHSLTAIDVGMPSQQVALDGVPLDAPPGTSTFTGPEGCHLHLERSGDAYVLFVDGQPVREVLASGSSEVPSEMAWTIFFPGAGEVVTHQVRVSNMGGQGQQLFIDGVDVPAPPGTTTFTGPAGSLLEVSAATGGLSLMVDGVPVDEFNARTKRAVEAMPGARAAVAPDFGLPQGVSLDSDTGKYKANIRIGGRFVSLGEFSSPEEAHQRYLEEKKKHGMA